MSGETRRRPGRPRHETPSPDYVKRRSQLIGEAAKVFQSKGYEAGSLDDVASALGLRKASLYYYVQSKGELLYLVFDRAISLAIQRIEHLVHEGSSPRDRLEAVIRHQVHTITGDLSLFGVFFDHRPYLDQEYETLIRAKERRYIRLFAEAVQDAVNAGVLGAADPRYAAHVLLGMTNWTYKWFDPERDDAAAFADVAVALLLGGNAGILGAAGSSDSSPATDGRP